MASSRCRRAFAGGPVDETKLSDLVTVVVHNYGEMKTGLEQLGSYLFTNLFGGDWSTALRFRENSMYQTLLETCEEKHGIPRSHLRKVIHTEIWGHVLQGSGQEKAWERLSYLHRHELSRVSFKHVNFVAETAQAAFEGDWTVSSLRTYVVKKMMEYGEGLTERRTRNLMVNPIKNHTKSRALREGAGLSPEDVVGLFTMDDLEQIQPELDVAIAELSAYKKALAQNLRTRKAALKVLAKIKRRA